MFLRNVGRYNSEDRTLKLYLSVLGFILCTNITRQCNIRVLNVRGRVGKEGTDGSKTAVMDVIGILCVSIGGGTVLQAGRSRDRIPMMGIFFN
jgi:hypothetical protein